jgi:hypothetical protein
MFFEADVRLFVTTSEFTIRMEAPPSLSVSLSLSLS